jgi:hypothetical protein
MIHGVLDKRTDTVMDLCRSQGDGVCSGGGIGAGSEKSVMLQIWPTLKAHASFIFP